MLLRQNQQVDNLRQNQQANNNDMSYWLGKKNV